MEGYIKLYRKLIDWQWYKISEMVHLFIHLLLTANHKDGEWQGINVKRGQVITGRKNLASVTGLSQQSIRTCIRRLKSTSEITTKSTNKFTIITLCNYDDYQKKEEPTNQQINQPANQQSTSNQPATNQQLTTNKNEKNDKNEKNIVKTSKIKKMKNERFIIPPTVEMVKAYCEERKNKVDPEKFVNNYEAKGWKIGNNKMIDWQASVRTWESNGKKYDSHGDTKNNNRQIKNVNALWDNTL